MNCTPEKPAAISRYQNFFTTLPANSSGMKLMPEMAGSAVRVFKED